MDSSLGPVGSASVTSGAGAVGDVVPVSDTVHDPTLEVQVSGALKVPLSVMPTVAVAPGASVPFHDALVAVRIPPVSVDVAFHMLTLLPAQGIDTDQPLIVELPVLVIVRSTLRPEPQSEVTATPTVMADADAGTGVGVGAGMGAGVGVGAGVGTVVLESTEAVLPDSEPAVSLPRIEQVPAGMVQEVGASGVPLEVPRKPNVALERGAMLLLHAGPVRR